ncbi:MULTISPECIES: AfsR/SARP family transcriptional regulator [unclassified Streptomyces]|uniref:AfsR/SARP family transcriptional regulator n=1 Tax=unclassified Streptomyces TaxID=2593676 RepID=UPI002DDA31B3|nr:MULTISPECIES: AfsR/SARP family transcriptional regulator [unclassified Streptomyces]WSA95456.1 AfsR/SARP family transcriptional regulator [Streptomyces sp. NBC_01795]WSB79872.1 AfsR/SARP family transcriptional regulator [Streptomyces sp. NBC_01775]WSS11921.1 AfsR/SARP family transcriptional regulator [Streptomyces sp. NBC_01186]WSS40635.1 AfsR/SARP family transcriptional regulator [Streptomyces sp. NBC_01187]
MHIRVLGTLHAETAGASIVPSAAKPRQILALLALNSRHIVPVPDLMEEVWGANPPRSAPTTLQTYILQLRRRLRTALGEPAGDGAGPGGRDVPGDKDILATRHGGYQLEVAESDVDALEFERLTRAGHSAFETGDMAKASHLLTSALALWRGPALADLPHGKHLAIEVTRLEESRLGAIERRIAADLRLGRHREVLGELCALRGRYPLYENLHALLMIAFHQDGRSSDALIAFKRLRGTLVEELGLEPSPRLDRLHQAILRGEDALSAWSDPAGAGEAAGIAG